MRRTGTQQTRKRISYNDRTSVVKDGLQRMEQELLRQPDPASPWSLELGRMLECAEALTIKKMRYLGQQVQSSVHR